MIKNYLPYYPFFRTWMRKYPTLKDVLLQRGMPSAVSLDASHGKRTFCWSFHRKWRDDVRRHAFCLQVLPGGVGKCYDFYKVSFVMTPGTTGFEQVGSASYDGVSTWLEDIKRALGNGYHKVAPSGNVLAVMNP